MTRQQFDELTAKGVVILDGATGSNLRKAGMPVGISSEQWVLENPSVLQELQRAYVDAGSQIVYAPTFAANPISLRNFSLQDRVAELNTKLVKICKDGIGNRALVAGDITTTGQLMEPRGTLTYNELYEAYQEQMKALVDAGVDLFVAETMLSVDETVVALDAAQAVCDLPMICTLSLEADGNSLYAVAFNVCKNQQDAEDAVQDTFLQYYNSKKEFESEQHIRAWLIRVAINKAKNMNLSFWRKNKTSLGDYMETLVFETPESEHLFETVMGLPEKYRIVIHLFYYEDYSVREIGEILKISESNVKVRLSRGRMLLRETLKEEWDDDK